MTPWSILGVALMLVAVSFLASPGTAHASDGNLVTSFGDQGALIQNISSSLYSDVHVESAASDGSGGLFLVGFDETGPGGADFAVLHVDAFGQLDPNFGEGGLVLTDFGGVTSDVAHDIALDTSGRLVVAGTTNNNSGYDVALARYNSDGSLDTTFGTNGLVVHDIGSDEDIAHAVTIGTDGKIVVAGQTKSVTGFQDFLIARYDSNGTPDPTFSSDGVVSRDVGTNDVGYDVAIDSVARIVATGTTNSRAAVMRYLTDGTPDSTFGSSGIVVRNTSSQQEGRAIAVDASDGLAVAGYSVTGGTGEMTVARYTSTGTPDTSFSGDGIATTTGNRGFASDVKILSDGSIMLAGQNFDLAKFTVAGDLDTSFGTDGIAHADVVADKPDYGQSLIEDGTSITLAGYTDASPVMTPAVARFDESGVLDVTYGSGGVSSIETKINHGSRDSADAIATLPDGEIVVGGSTAAAGSSDGNFVLTEYDADGFPNTSFGDNGTVITDFSGQGDSVYDLAIDDVGRIVASGSSGNNAALARYNPDGSLDTTFGNGGKVTLGFPNSAGAFYGVAIDSAGRIVVGGQGSAATTTQDFLAARYTTDGILDTSFDVDGFATTDFGSNTSENGYDVVVDSQDRVSVVGYSGNDAAAVRYLTDGSLDTSFDGDGISLIPVTDSAFIGGGVVDANDRIVAGGSDGDNVLLVRWNSDGTPDETFGSAGVLDEPVPGFDFGYVGDIALDAAGNVIGTGAAGSDLLALRATPDGTFDTNFASNGFATYDAGTSSDFGQAIVAADDGSIFAAGGTRWNNGDILITKFEGSVLVTPTPSDSGSPSPSPSPSDSVSPSPSPSVTPPPDTTPPLIALMSPVDGAHYGTGTTLTADYQCFDSGSGIASCTGNVANGAAVSTSTSGTYTFTVTARDVAGNQFVKSSTYQIMDDQDGDGLPDLWETQGIDFNHDGTIDLALNQPPYSADPLHKDVYVEIDSMSCAVNNSCVGSEPTSHAPQANTVPMVTAAFAAAPVLNPDGTTGVRFHAFVDETVPEITTIHFDPVAGSYNDFDDVKRGTVADPCDGFFGTPAERVGANCANLLGAKRLAVHYALFGHNYYESVGSSGIAEYPGNDFMVTVGGSAASWIQADGSLDVAEAGTLMHELGHNLGLGHGGPNNNVNCKPNYLSVMSYSLQGPYNDPATWKLDYSRAALPSLDESSLSEILGAQGPATRNIVYGVGFTTRVAPANGAVDWNGDGDKTDTGVASDVNRVSGSCNDPSPGETLTGADDWANLVYNISSSLNAADGNHSTADILLQDPDVTATDAVAISETTDAENDGFANAEDNCPGVANPSQMDQDHDGIGDTCDTMTVIGIDIVPGSSTNSINQGSKQTVSVAILSTASFNAVTQVNKASLTFGRSGNEVSFAKCSRDPVDVNKDGRMDLVCMFTISKTGLRVGDTTAILKGTATGIAHIYGTDTVRVVR